MHRYRYRSYGAQRDWSRYHASKLTALTSRFGPIVGDVQQRFLALDPNLLERVFDAYARAHGDGPGRYARATYAAWSSGRIQMSGQTAERLIELVPGHLSAADRLELVAKLRGHYFRPSHATLTCDLDSWEPQLLAIVTDMVGKANASVIPSNLMHSARWLAGDDVREGQRLLVEAEEQEARVRLSYLRSELDSIRRALVALEGGKTTSVSHTIEIPQGTIHLEVSQRREGLFGRFRSKGVVRMADDQLVPQNPNPQRRDLLAPPSPSKNLLDDIGANLSDEDRRAIAPRVFEAKLAVDRAQKEAENRFRNGAQDMVNTVGLVNELDRTKGDYEVNSEFNTASGQTRIKVKKATNMSIVVIVIAVALVLVLALRR